MCTTSTPAAVARAMQLFVVPRSIPQAVVFIGTSSREGVAEVGRGRCGCNYDARSQECSVGPPIALFENPVNPHVGMTVACAFANGFGNANADALRLRPGNRSRLPSGPAEEDAFRAF